MKKINIFFAANKNIAPFLTVSLESIKRNNEGCFLNIFIATSDLGERERDYLKEIIPKEKGNISFIDFTDEFKFEVDKIYSLSKEIIRYPFECKAKLLVAKLLPDDIERCLYLDVDTLVIGELDGFYDTDFEENVLVACADMTMESWKKCNARRKNRFSDYHYKLCEHAENFSGEKYFNAGVMLLNVTKLRNDYTYEMYQKAVLEMGCYMPTADQDIANWIYRDSVKLLEPMQYNLQFSYDTLDMIERSGGSNIASNCKIIHYLSKPWTVWSGGRALCTMCYQLWWDYAKFSIFYSEWLMKLNQGLIQSKRKECFLTDRSIKNASDYTVRMIIKDCFDDCGYKNIGVYGAGIYGKLFMEDMPKGYNYYFYDKEVRRLGEYGVLTPEEITDDLDIIIITPFYIEEIRYDLECKFKKTIIDLDLLIRWNFN